MAKQLKPETTLGGEVSVASPPRRSRSGRHAAARSAIGILLGLLILSPVVNSLDSASATVFRDPLDVFLDAINVIALIPSLPLVVTAVALLPLAHQVAERNAVNLRMRGSTTSLLLGMVRRSFVPAFLVFFAFIAVAGIFAFVVAPTMPIYSFDPQAYGLTPDQLASDALERSTFTSLLSDGATVFVAAYALWVGTLAGIFAIAGGVSILLVRNRVLGLLLPWAIYLAETVIAAMTVGPQWGLAYAAFPAGLATFETLPLVLPLAVVLAVSVICWVRVWVRPESAYGLS